jgi:hypothetical protein
MANNDQIKLLQLFKLKKIKLYKTMLHVPPGSRPCGEKMYPRLFRELNLAFRPADCDLLTDRPIYPYNVYKTGYVKSKDF